MSEEKTKKEQVRQVFAAMDDDLGGTLARAATWGASVKPTRISPETRAKARLAKVPLHALRQAERRIDLAYELGRAAVLADLQRLAPELLEPVRQALRSAPRQTGWQARFDVAEHHGMLGGPAGVP